MDQQDAGAMTLCGLAEIADQSRRFVTVFKGGAEDVCHTQSPLLLLKEPVCVPEACSGHESVRIRAPEGAFRLVDMS